ncbi:MAG: hypothetical protein LQ343_004289 [Gyalolechia ehrenbergii]|nr:MAG: hypothetical protein LQ343_004289 [Gyalolechia ehrenbergii]
MAKERKPLVMEAPPALSPRSANIQMKPRASQKNVVDQGVNLIKPKDHASPPPSLVLQPPETPGGLTVQYRVGRELGKGGFAICYEGQQRGAHGGKTYALKIVKASMAQKKMEEKFRTELQIHAKMRHPNIVEFHKAFTFKENTYVVLELCPNGSIQDMVRARKGISLPEIRRFVVQLCGAIKYMHARNVIHRDLKMGNLFLDHEMNVKIGDFGLAAILVSPGEYEGSYTKALSRRTTLCGTPNYIAPEILDKGKRGHDLKAKAVDYRWPEPETIRSDVPEEAKELVAALLRPDPKDRINLDQVVSHPFFSMHGGGCMPAVLDPSCRQKRPRWLSLEKPRGDVMLTGAPRLQLRDLGRQCGVGYFDRNPKSFEVVGGDVDISLYKACLAEETAGTCPLVPLPADTVYSGKTSPEARSAIRDSNTPPVPLLPNVLGGQSHEILEPLPEDEQIDLVKPASPRRSASQNHAKNLRPTYSRSAALRTSARAISDSAAGDPSSENTRQPSAESASVRISQGLMHERPVRMTKTLPRNTSRVTRSQKSGLTKEDAIPIHDEEAKPSPRRLTKDEIIDQLSPNPDAKRRELALRGKARIAANLQNELNALTSADKEPSKESLPTRTSRAPITIGWLVSPQENVERLPETTANNVCVRLELLRKELHQALLYIGESLQDPALELDLDAKPRQTPPLITKWVDYTNKLGVGYTLDDGSMGCLLKANESYDNPQCGILVANTRAHYHKRNDPTYTEACQIVPQPGPPVEFSEISEEEGVTRVLVPASRFKVIRQAGGLKMKSSRDIHENEKRRRLSIWNRFAEYMAHNLAADASDETKSNIEQHVPGPCLRFYQRIGNVSVWMFVDGAFQVNFPDHTKLILHNDGTWIDFFYMPPAVLKRLKAGKPLDQQMLDSRKKLGYSPAAFLALYSGDKTTALRTEDIKFVVQVNEVKSKIEFVRDVLGIWVQEGGLGKLGKNKYFKWDGFQAKKGLAWVSVGASGGDIYYKWPSVKE